MRPSNDWDAPFLPCERLEVCCRPGDQLVIDTAAWYHATSIPPGTDFTWSVAQDLSSEENTIELESVQLRVSHQLCQLCMTPTAEPMGSPPGTCGCDCCSQKRLNHRLWRCFRQSGLLTQRFIESSMRDRTPGSFNGPSTRLAICDAAPAKSDERSARSKQVISKMSSRSKAIRPKHSQGPWRPLEDTHQLRGADSALAVRQCIGAACFGPGEATHRDRLLWKRV